MAQEIVARFHSQQAAEAALADFEARFRHGTLPEDMPEHTISIPDNEIALVQILKLAGLTASTSEALRMIDQGAVKLDGGKVEDKALQIQGGASVTIQVGKRKFARVTIQSSGK